MRADAPATPMRIASAIEIALTMIVMRMPSSNAGRLAMM
jgi:hypothetical protein